MPLAPCPDCGTPVSTSAEKCPQCGRPTGAPPPPAPVPATAIVSGPARSGGGFMRGLQVRLLLLTLGVGAGFIASWLFGPAHALPFGDYCRTVTSANSWAGYSPFSQGGTSSGSQRAVAYNVDDPRTALILWGLGGAFATMVVGSLAIGAVRPATSRPPGTPGHAALASAPTSGLAIAGMVLGIISLLATCVPLVSLPCGALAIVLGSAAHGSVRRGRAAGGGMASAGIVCGFIPVLIWAVIFTGVLGGGAALLGGGHHR